MVGPSASRLIFLRQSVDIERVKKLGRRRRTPFFTMLCYPSGLPQPRMGVVVGKRFGIAVQRNRAKRLFRELGRHCQTGLINGHDVLIYPRRESLAVGHATLKEAWEQALAQEGVLKLSVSSACDKSALQ